MPNSHPTKTKRRPKLPANTYWHRGVLYGRFRTGGKAVTWSLKTSDIRIARIRIEEARQRRLDLKIMKQRVADLGERMQFAYWKKVAEPAAIAVHTRSVGSRDDLDRLASLIAKQSTAEARQAWDPQLDKIIHRHVVEVLADYFRKPDQEEPPGAPG
jgi:hypothetical protein